MDEAFRFVGTDGRESNVSWPELLAAIEAGAVQDLTAMEAPQRPGVVTALAICMTVLRLYSRRERPWSEAAWGREWDEQLGADTRRIVAPIAHPALFQPPVGAGAKTAPVSLLDAGVGFVSAAHGEKPMMHAAADAWICAIMGGIARPHSNYYPATIRAGAFVAFPSDGSLHSEVNALAAAYEASKNTRRASSAREHLPWVSGRGATPALLSDLPSPILNIERTVRLLADGAALREPNNTRMVAPARWIDDPQDARLADVQGVRRYTLSAGRPWSYRALHALLAGADILGKSKSGVQPSTIGTVDAPSILAGMTTPAVRVCGLATGNGKVLSYREALLPVPAPARGRFGSRLARETSTAILKDLSTARGALVAAFGAAGAIRRVRTATKELHPAASACLAAWDSTCGEGSLAVLLDHMASDQPLQELSRRRRSHLRSETRSTWAWAARAFTPLAQARGEDALIRGLERLDREGQEAAEYVCQRKGLDGVTHKRTTVSRPNLAVRIERTLHGTAGRLTPNDKAALRASTAPMPAWKLVAAAGDMAPPRLAALWRDIGSALGNLAPWGPRVGSVLAETRWPERRMAALLAARGGAASGLVAEALRWMIAKRIERVELTPLVTMAVADAFGDREAADWARLCMARDYVRAP